MNHYSQVKQNGLETFVSNLNNLYIDLLIDDVLKTHQKAEYSQLIDQALLDHDETAFLTYTNALKQLEDN
ncbi:IDEAL domain-containing protein [Macrococcus equipercicus]|uniref:IDEAL domain-containing protein n=1 Tax=Macrococcus equipercicus TaxID=69967 RepID=A0A9Q9F0Y2_9STAP|nr:IDEAL domain-containing protein [Macrococcus equipercicus]KAA1039155.1 IDEAL domain-containing protein [Macrococcus equipercicus]UTH13332.1 IDEAL domain-containing protein [Macrococcus equipercicus]